MFCVAACTQALCVHIIMSFILHFSFCIISKTYVFKLPYIYRCAFNLLSFISCVIAYLFIHTIVVSSFVLCIYLFCYLLKILYSAVASLLILYRVIISSNDFRQVQECM
jgi:hypothetical protein